jgi:hypothetical protein
MIEQLQNQKQQAIKQAEIETAKKAQEEQSYKKQLEKASKDYYVLSQERNNLINDNALLNSKIFQLSKKRKLIKSEEGMLKFNPTLFWSVIFIVLGGMFWFGYYVGTTKYDKDKIQLDETNKQLRYDTSSLQQQINQYKIKFKLP